MVMEIEEYMNKRPNAVIVVGSDSQKIRHRFCFATAIAIYDPGHGGIFYIKKDYKKPHRNFGTIKSMIAWKVYEEAGLITQMVLSLIESGVNVKDKITHHDLSENGLSGEHIPGVKGWMLSMGFHPEFKPQSVIASGIANLYSKK